jgi:hypothetical protein
VAREKSLILYPGLSNASPRHLAASNDPIHCSDDTLPFAIGPLRLNRPFYDGALYFDLPGALTVM